MTRGAAMLAALLLAGLFLPLRAEEPEELFGAANSAYEDGRYEEAVELYQRVLRYGIRDVRAEYNLGNALFRSGRLGPAILHYERARRLAPTDEDVRRNLEFARSRRFDRIEEVPPGAAVSAMLALQDRLGPDAQAALALVVSWLACLLVCWGLRSPGAWRAWTGWALAGCLLLALLLATSWWTTYRRLDGGPTVVVMAEAANVLAGPGENNAVLFVVHEGLDLELRARRDEWLQVRAPNGLSGWLRHDAVERV